MFIFKNSQKQKFTNKKAFTLIELLMVIAIIGIIAVISMVLLKNMRAKSRDVKRITDIKQVHTALEMYYDVVGSYPDNLNGPIQAGGKVFLNEIPSNPSPSDDGDCSGSDYIYATSSNGSRYTLDYCISTQVGNIVAGNYSAIPETISSVDSLPLAFSFTDIEDSPLSTATTSNISIISGIGNGINVSITGAASSEYRICDDGTCSSVDQAWTSSNFTINNDQYLQLRMTSNPLILQTDTASVTVGSETKDWSVSTQACTSGTCYGVEYDTSTEELSGYAWSPSEGYISMKGNGYGVVVPLTGGNITGDAWGTSTGYISFDDNVPGDGVDYGVTYNATTEELSGYAWGPSVGYIKMDGVDYQVTVPVGGGYVTGYAWGSSIGYIKFTGSVIP